jgi:DNA gyrase inhibitor GyrI
LEVNLLSGLFQVSASPASCLETNAGVLQRDIVAGKYAVCTVKRKAKATEQSRAKAFQQLSANDYLPETRLILEPFEVALVSQRLCEICVSSC